MRDAINAIITSNSDSQREVRCGHCGKLLFVTDGIFKKDVDFSSQNAIIVARCTRSYCKIDNRVQIQDIFTS